MNNNFNNYGFPVNNNPFMNQPNGVGGGNTPYFAPTKPMEYDGYFGSNPEPPKPSFMDKLSGFFERYGGSILKWGAIFTGLGFSIGFLDKYRKTDVSYGNGAQKPDDNAGFMPKFKYAVCNFFSSDLGWLKPHTAKETDKAEATSTPTAPAPAQAGNDEAIKKQVEKTTKRLSPIIQELEKALKKINDDDTKNSLSESIEKLKQSVNSMPSLDISGLSSKIGTINGEIDKLQAEIKTYNTSSQLEQLNSQIQSFKTELGKLQKMMNKAQNKAFYQTNGNDSFGFETDSKKFKSLQKEYKMKGVTFDNSELSSSFIPKHTYFYQNSANVATFLDTNSPFSTPLSQDDIAYLNSTNQKDDNGNNTKATRQSILGAMSNAYKSKQAGLQKSNLINLINGISLVSTVSSSKKESKGLKAPTIDDAKRAMSFYKQILDDLQGGKLEAITSDEKKQEVLKAISDAINNIYDNILNVQKLDEKNRATIYPQIIGLRKLLVQQKYCTFMSNSVDKTFSTFSDNLDMSALCNLFNLNFDHDLKINFDDETSRSIDYAKDLEALHDKFNKMIKETIDPTQQQQINDYCYTLLKVIDTVSKKKEDFPNHDAVLETARAKLRDVLPYVKDYEYTVDNGGSSKKEIFDASDLRNVAMDFELVALEDDIQQGKKIDDIEKELQAAARLIFSDPEADEKALTLIPDEPTKPTTQQQASFITVLTEVYLHKNTGSAREKALTYLKAMMKTYDSKKDTKDADIQTALQKAINNIIAYSLKRLKDFNGDTQESAFNTLNIISENPTLLTTNNIGQIFKVFENAKYLIDTVKEKLIKMLVDIFDKNKGLLNDDTINSIKNIYDKLSTSAKHVLQEKYKEDVNFSTFFDKEKKNEHTIQEWNALYGQVFSSEGKIKENVQSSSIVSLIEFYVKNKDSYKDDVKLTTDQLQALAKADIYKQENEAAIKQLIELATGSDKAAEVINIIMGQLKGDGVTVTAEMFEALKKAVFNNTNDSLVDGVNVNDVIALCAKQDKPGLTPEQLQALADKVEYKEENKETIKQLIELANGAKATSVINTIMEKLKGAGDDVVKAVFESLKNAVFTGSGTDTKLVDGVNTNDVIALCAKQEKPELTPDQLRTLAVKLYISNNGTYEFDSTVTSETINNFIKLLKKGINNAELKYNVQTIAKTLDQITNWPDGLGDLKSSLEALKKGG